jgi:hypothetical protein
LANLALTTVGRFWGDPLRKIAAKSKPTYLAPLDAPTTDFKKAEYETIWNSAKPI